MSQNMKPLSDIDSVISACAAKKRTLAMAGAILVVLGPFAWTLTSAGPWTLIPPLACIISIILADDEAYMDEIQACRSGLMAFPVGRLVMCDLDALFEAQGGRLMKSQLRAFNRMKVVGRYLSKKA